jgi:hypothetical protein
VFFALSFLSELCNGLRRDGERKPFSLKRREQNFSIATIIKQCYKAYNSNNDKSYKDAKNFCTSTMTNDSNKSQEG